MRQKQEFDRQGSLESTFVKKELCLQAHSYKMWERWQKYYSIYQKNEPTAWKTGEEEVFVEVQMSIIEFNTYNMTDHFLKMN